MIGTLHLPPVARYHRRAQRLATWQRLLVGIALVVALLISSALVYFQPGTHSFTLAETAPLAPATQAMPALPPGTDTYYYWGSITRADNAASQGCIVGAGIV